MSILSAFKFPMASLVLLTLIAVPVHATITTTGDADPGGAATQPDPWAVGEDLFVGKTGTGTLNIEAGGVWVVPHRPRGLSGQFECGGHDVPN